MEEGREQIWDHSLDVKCRWDSVLLTAQHIAGASASPCQVLGLQVPWVTPWGQMDATHVVGCTAAERPGAKGPAIPEQAANKPVPSIGDVEAMLWSSAPASWPMWLTMRTAQYQAIAIPCRLCTRTHTDDHGSGWTASPNNVSFKKPQSSFELKH